MAIKIIIDTDPGCDDAIALVAALTSPLFDVIGITSIGGNVDPVQTQRNALGICAMVDRSDVPVIAGCDKPLVKRAVLADHVHGETGVQGLVLPAVAMPQATMDAADFILRETKKHDDITLVVIGPMTNIALAYLRDNTLPERVREIVTMGGAYGDPSGNITPFAEFNIFCDPHAAKIVYDNFPRIRALPLDVTHKTLQDVVFRDWLRAQGGHGTNLATMLDGYAATYPKMEGRGVSPLHDFHTIAALVEPALYTWKKGSVTVAETGEREGQTKISDASDTCAIAVSVDKNRFFALLKAMLT
jgi:purine nucleosidase